MTTKRTTAEAMSARREKLREEHAQAVRERIQTTQLVERLQKFAMGDAKVKMTPAQIKAMEMLLDKTLPNLASVKHEVDAKQVTFLIDTNIPDGAGNDSVQATG